MIWVIENIVASPGRRRLNRACREGMTLVEALAASVLLGVGVVGLMSAGAQALRNQHRTVHRAAAMHLAQAKLAEIEVVGPHIWMLGRPTTGSVARDDVVFDWEIDIEQQLVGELFGVSVEVRWQANTGSGTVELATWLNDYRAKMLEAPEPPVRPGGDQQGSRG